MVTNSVTSGTQTNFTFRGFNVVPAGGGTMANPAVWVVAIEGHGGIKDVAIACKAGGVALGIQDSGSTAGDNNALTFVNVWLFGGGSSQDCNPLRIWGPTSTGSGSGLGITFIGGAVTDITSSSGTSCPAGDDCLVSIDGASGCVSLCNTNTHYIGAITFVGTYFESKASETGSYIEARNTRGVELINVYFNGPAGTTLTNCVWIGQTAVGVNTGLIHVTGEAHGSQCTNLINNTINGNECPDSPRRVGQDRQH
jgi:hypothetical protein